MESTADTRLPDADQSSAGGGILRLAGAADRDAIFALVNAAFVLERPLKKGGRERLGDDGELEARMRRGVFLVCEQAGGLTAAVYLEPRYEGRSGHCYLGLLSIAPPRQRSGLGRRMMQAAEEYAREQGCIAMDLRVLSQREQKLVPLYLRFGYRVEGALPYPEALAAKMVAPGHFISMTKAL